MKRPPGVSHVGFPSPCSPPYCLLSFNLFFFSSFCLFQGHTCGILRFLGQGSNQCCSRQPTSQPQQRRIRAKSATYTTAHRNAGSSTHWARPGIEPQPHGPQSDSLTTEPGRELHNLDFKQVNYKMETKGFDSDVSKNILIGLHVKNILDLNFTFLKYI